MKTTITTDQLIPSKYRLPAVEVEFHERLQLDGTSLWSVNHHGNVLNKEGEWEYEPQPSSRDAAFLNRCRFASVEEAVNAFNNRKVAYE